MRDAYTGTKGGSPVGGRAALQQQTILYQGYGSDAAVREETRIISAEPVNYSTRSGWYLDLIYGNEVEGERLVEPPALRGERILFMGMIPGADACSAGGASWLTELDYLSGERLPYSPFDLNNDSDFADDITVTLPDPQQPGKAKTTALPASAVHIASITQVPAFVSLDTTASAATVGAGTLDLLYEVDAHGNLALRINPASIGSGRQSWRPIARCDRPSG